MLTAYSITTANNVPDRDPVRWRLEGSGDGITWRVLDDRTSWDEPSVPHQRLASSASFSIGAGRQMFAELADQDKTIVSTLAAAITKYVQDNQEDSAADERWRVTVVKTIKHMSRKQTNRVHRLEQEMQAKMEAMEGRMKAMHTMTETILAAVTETKSKEIRSQTKGTLLAA